MKKVLIIFDHKFPAHLLKEKIREILEIEDFAIIGEMYEHSIFKTPVDYQGYEKIIFTSGYYALDKPRFQVAVEYPVHQQDLSNQKER